MPGMSAKDDAVHPTRDQGEKFAALVPPLQGDASGEYRFWPVLLVKPVLMISHARDVGTGFLFCPEVIARDIALVSDSDTRGNDMKPFAKSFYHSSAWQSCRSAYISERRKIDGGICEQCREAPGEELHHTTFLTPQNINDAEVSLNPEKLQWLCKDCHFKAHRKAIMQGFEKRRNKRILTNGVYFDESGQPVPQRIVIVWGPPASGKSSYIRQHMDSTDLVVDLDFIRQALTMGGRDSSANNLLGLSLAVREYLYSLIAERDILVDCRTVWIAATLPKRSERNALADRLNAELVFIDRPLEECLELAASDDSRTDRLMHHEIIERWFENYEP